MDLSAKERTGVSSINNLQHPLILPVIYRGICRHVFACLIYVYINLRNYVKSMFTFKIFTNYLRKTDVYRHPIERYYQQV